VKPRVCLPVLERQASRRLVRLKILVAPAGRFDWQEMDRRTAYVAIESMNLWGSFCRLYYLSTAMGAKDAAGRRVSTAAGPFATRQDAIGYAIQNVKPSVYKKKASSPWTWWDEPMWGNPSDFTKAMKALQPSNLAAVVSATALPTDVFTELPKFRHFYAHRGEETARKARRIAPNYLLSPKLHPTAILNNFGPMRPQTIICEWLDDMRFAVGLMA